MAGWVVAVWIVVLSSCGRCSHKSLSVFLDGIGMTICGCMTDRRPCANLKVCTASDSSIMAAFSGQEAFEVGSKQIAACTISVCIRAISCQIERMRGPAGVVSPDRATADGPVPSPSRSDAFSPTVAKSVSDAIPTYVSELVLSVRSGSR